MSLYVIKIIFLSIQNTHHKKLIFQNRPQPISELRSTGPRGAVDRRAHTCTVLSNRSTDSRPAYSTDQTWSSRPCIGRPAVDRQVTGSYSPGRPAVDRNSTDQTWSSRTLSGRPEVDRHPTALVNPSRPEVDRRSTVRPILGQISDSFPF